MTSRAIERNPIVKRELMILQGLKPSDTEYDPLLMDPTNELGRLNITQIMAPRRTIAVGEAGLSSGLSTTADLPLTESTSPDLEISCLIRRGVNGVTSL